MKAKIATTLSTSEARMWEELRKISTLMHVASPILIFRPRDEEELPEQWEVGKQYSLCMSAFGIIPLGKHSIVVKRIDPVNREIETHESDTLTKTWDHLLRVTKIDESRVRYTDEVEIKAGVLTVFIWLFAHVFYRHRQRKWRKLLLEVPIGFGLKCYDLSDPNKEFIEKCSSRDELAEAEKVASHPSTTQQ